jgi:hypothetical protein
MNKKKRKYSCDRNNNKHAIKKKKRATAETGQCHHHHDRQNTLHIIDLFMNCASKKRHKYTQQIHQSTHIHRQRNQF